MAQFDTIHENALQHPPYKAGIIREADLVELGEIIKNHSLQRQSSNQITIADLTGVSMQDIQIAKSILFA